MDNNITIKITEEDPQIADSSLTMMIGSEPVRNVSINREALEAGLTISMLTDNDPAFIEMIKWSFESMDSIPFLKESMILDIPPGTVLTKPVVFEYKPDNPGQTVFFNLFINAGRNSSLEIILKISADKEDSSINFTSIIFAEEGADLKTALISDLSSSSSLSANRKIRLEKDSGFLDFQNLNGSKISESRTEVILNGKNANAELFGTFITEGDEHMDIKTIQNHILSSGTSQANMRTVVRDRGRMVYSGLIEVGEKGEFTDAYLTSNSIVLDSKARSDSTPALKIRNKNVKCSHGATTGKLSPAQIFYLESRGMTEEDAKKYILEGFFNNILDSVPDSFSDISGNIIRSRL